MDNVEPPAHSPPWPDAQPILSQPRFMESQTMLSFENLIALANNIDARNLLWRDKRQPVVDLPTLRDCLKHAIAGGTSAYRHRSLHYIFHFYYLQDQQLWGLLSARLSVSFFPS